MMRQVGGHRAWAIAFSLSISLAGLLRPDAAAAQDWPSRPITAVVSLAAGSASDVIARVAMDQVSRQIGRPIVVENRVGAGGAVGANSVAKAAPDGYTLLASGTLGSVHGLYPTLPYATLEDFAAVIPLGQQPLVLVTAPATGYRTLGDLIAAAKARPGAMNFASAGVGSASHFAAERLRISAGFQGQHIPFRGATEAMTEVMAGRVDFFFTPAAPALPLIRDGKLVALAVSAAKRASALPQVPTTTEAGLADSVYHFWTGLFVPARTPPDIVARLYRETETALQTTAVRERLAAMGVEPMPMSPQQFDRFFRDDVAANVKLVKDANIPRQ